jgi:hypothetical protein
LALSPQSTKLFLYGSQNCPASYANSIEGFEGIESFNNQNVPIIDPHSYYSFEASYTMELLCAKG